MRRNRYLTKACNGLANLLYEIFPFCKLHYANSKISSQIKNISDGISEPMTGRYENLNTNRLIAFYKQSLTSKKTIEDKIKVSLTSLTLSTSFLAIVASISLSESFQKLEVIDYWLIIFMFIITASYLLSSAIMAMSVIGEKNLIYIISPEEENDIGKDEIKLKDCYATIYKLNILTNIIRQNFMSTSFKCIRNGIITMIIIPLLFLMGNGKPSHAYNSGYQIQELRKSLIDELKTLNAQGKIFVDSMNHKQLKNIVNIYQPHHDQNRTKN